MGNTIIIVSSQNLSKVTLREYSVIGFLIRRRHIASGEVF